MAPEGGSKRSEADVIVNRIKNKRPIAWIIAIAVIVLAVLTYTTKLVETTGKLVEQVLNLSGSRAHSQEKELYQLGRNVATVSLYETGKGSSVPDDVRRIVSQAYAEIGDTLKKVGVSADPKQLNFVSPIGTFQDSTGAYFIGDRIA